MVRVGIVIVLFAVFAALAGPFLSPYDPSSQELARRLGVTRQAFIKVRLADSLVKNQ